MDLCVGSIDPWMDVPGGRGAQRETCVAPLRSIRRCLSSLFRLSFIAIPTEKKTRFPMLSPIIAPDILKNFSLKVAIGKKTFARRYTVFVSEFIFLDT